ncbi:MAG TPA: class I SAM-dependent methyltransferase [Opitutaceae bacterium]
MNHDYQGNVARFAGLADLYDRFRPRPPEALAGLLARYAGVNPPALVVDLGSGTGLSTRYWANSAVRVIGIEPNPEMRELAHALTTEPNVSFREGFAYDTGLLDGCADVAVCMQSLHWMEPETTFREISRLLRPGGVFAACDYDWPPSVGSAEVEAAYEACESEARRFEDKLGLVARIRRWNKSRHLPRMERSGFFSYARDLVLAHIDHGNAERLVGVLLSQGFVHQVQLRGISEADLGIEALRRTTDAILGSTLKPWHWSARVRLGVKGNG